MEISLTDFVDFLVSSGSPKLTKVRELKARGEYDPKFDFWKPLREHLIAFHEEGEGDKRYLDALLPTLTDEKKITAYPPLIANYKRWLGRKTIVKPGPAPKGKWTYKELTVRINPELLLSVNGQAMLIKLYFKRNEVSKLRLDLTFLLLSSVLGHRVNDDCRFAVLDIHHNKFFSVEQGNEALLPLLRGEAEAFITIWNSIDTD